MGGVLAYLADAHGDETGFVFLRNGEDEHESITFRTLSARATSIATAMGGPVAANERALLLLPSGLDFIPALFGCFYTGAIAVPMHAHRISENFRKLQSISADSGARFVLTTRAIFDQVHALGPDEPLCRDGVWVCVDTMPAAEPIDDVPRDGRSIALLQYTSGSTGAPKGVMVSHQNILDNARLSAARQGFNDGDKTMSWLPLFHDMGLIGCVLGAMAIGMRETVLMSPLAFAQKPARWLRAISKYRATVSAAPNSAYEWCVKRISDADLEGVDLTSWRIATFGAETVRAKTMTRFIERFAPHGFRPAAVAPAYGLAEATLAVSAGRATELPNTRQFDEHGSPDNGRALKGARDVVACGRLLEGHEVVIADPITRTRNTGNRAGEIWLRGPCVAQGYWNNPVLTGEVFQSYLADSDEGPYLRTGDLGVYEDGELFILGRIKDLIIIDGANHYPDDLEVTVGQCDERLSPDNVFAFAQDDGEKERVVILVEAALGPSGDSDRNGDSTDTSLINGIRESLYRVHAVRPDYIGLVPPHSLPRTSSGKKRRREASAQFSRGQLVAYAEWDTRMRTRAPLKRSSQSLQRLTALWRAQFGLHDTEAPERIFDLGVTSLSILGFAESVEREFGITLPLDVLLDAPDIQALAARIDALQPSAAAPVKAIAPSPADRFNPFPLTEVQQAYWLGRRSEYVLGNIGAHVYLEMSCQRLDPARAAKAWNTLVTRHDMLRAVVVDDVSQRVLLNVPDYAIAVTDLSVEAESVRAGSLAEIRERMADEVFDPRRWPLFRVEISHVSDSQSLLHIGLDLIPVDASSIGILASEFVALYTDQDAALRAPAIAFRDYVVTTSSDADRTLERTRSAQYWLDRAPSLPNAPELPLAVPLQSIDRPAFVRREHRIPRARWECIRRSAGLHRVTPTAALLAAFSQVLAKWSATDHFVVNVTTFNRKHVHADVNGVVGDFTSLVLLEVRDAAQSDFSAFAEAVQRQLWRDLAHREFGSVRVLRELTRLRGGEGIVLAPVVFTSLLGLEGAFPRDFGRIARGVTQTPQVTLDHQVREEDGELVLTWDAVDAAFPSGMLDDMFAGYRGLVDALAEAPWPRSVDLVPETQLRQRRAVNETRTPLSACCLHELFIGSAQTHADCIAIVSGDRRISYSALLQASENLAARLMDAGVGPGEIVAVVMRKGWEQVVAALATMMTGAAYLPIDPDNPSSRVEQLLRLASVKLAILKQSEPGGAQISVPAVIVDDSVWTSRELPQLPAMDSSGLAYVIYTSGSTGEPKGVMIRHRSAVNTILDINQRFGVSSVDKVLAVSAFTFDLSVYDIFGLLAAGGTIVIPNADNQTNPRHWAELIDTENVTIWNTVPALASLLVSHCEHAQSGARVNALRLVLLSGDWIPLDLPPRLRRVCSHPAIVSLGGATEAAIWSIVHCIEQIDPAWTSIPYGKPLANQWFEVLDGSLKPRPVWATGKLYIGGEGLAIGYFNDAKRTDERFVTHPETGNRLYDTGDLGRYLPDGSIEFLGRADHQVKLNGYRVELGEIETVLRDHAEVSDAVVLARNDTGSGKRLTAYVVRKKGALRTDDPASAWQDPDRVSCPMPSHAPRECAGGELHGAVGHTDQPIREGLYDDADLAGRLETAFAGLREIVVEDRRKRLYASAGGLYPVQTYLIVPDRSLKAFEPGHYYYNPTEHCFELISPAADGDSRRDPFADKPPTIVFAADLRAIAPVYGPWSPDFARIEAGAMSQVLYESGLLETNQLEPLTVSAAERIRAALVLSDEHLLIGVTVIGRAVSETHRSEPGQPADLDSSSLARNFATRCPLLQDPNAIGAFKSRRLAQRQIDSCAHRVELSTPGSDGERFRLRRSYRCFDSVAIPRDAIAELLRAWAMPDPLQLFVAVHANRVDDLSEGIYRLSDDRCELLCLHPHAGVDVDLHEPVNHAACNDSAFTIIVAVNGDVPYTSSELLHNVGVVSHALEHVAPTIGLGLCQIGRMDWRCVGTILGGNLRPVHALVGGMVDAKRPLALDEPRLRTRSNVRQASTIAERLERFARSRLPAYMAPREWVILEALPLTSSGKVDRKALPAPDAQPSAFVAPHTPTEIVLAGVFTDLLRVDSVGVHDHFIDLGGDSLAAARAVDRLHGDLGIEVTVRDLYERGTIAALAAYVDEKTGAAHATHTAMRALAALESDAQLDSTFAPSPPAGSSGGNGILLSGASGFLGAHLLCELAALTNSRLYCLVRASDDEEAARTLHQRMAAMHLTIDAERVRAIAADLSKPYLGLDTRAFERLASDVGAVYHCGAAVNFALPYEKLRPSNVDGTREMLRLLSTGGAKHFHFVSSIAIFPRFGRGMTAVSERSDVRHGEPLETGYQQSKWVADVMVNEAIQRGLPITIYRPGNISGHSETGLWRIDDFGSGLLRACVELGAVPDLESTIELTPVDFVAHAIARLSLKPRPADVFHLMSPNTVSGHDLRSWLSELGYGVEVWEYSRWRGAIAAHASSSPNHPLSVFVGTLPAADRIDARVPFDSARTTEALRRLGIACPRIDLALMNAYVVHLRERGFLPLTSGAGAALT